MQNFAAVRGRSIIIAIVAITLLISVDLFVSSKIYLIAGVICGYIAALYYVLMLAARIKKSIILSGPGARRSAQAGMAFRIITLLLALLIMIKLAKAFFVAFVAGFFIMHIVLFINLIIFSYEEKIH